MGFSNVQDGTFEERLAEYERRRPEFAGIVKDMAPLTPAELDTVSFIMWGMPYEELAGSRERAAHRHRRKPLVPAREPGAFLRSGTAPGEAASGA